jgi:hypothetical protein
MFSENDVGNNYGYKTLSQLCENEDFLLAKKYEKTIRTFLARACLNALVPVKEWHEKNELKINPDPKKPIYFH